MSDFYKGYYEDHCFAHHGILGQKWGIRRYQNSDGSLTEAGRKRYGVERVDDYSGYSAKGAKRRLNDLDQAIVYNKRKYQDNTIATDVYGIRAKKMMNKMDAQQRPASERQKQKLQKIYRKNQESLKKAEKAHDMVEQGKSEIFKIFAGQVGKGNSVTLTGTTRNALTKGEKALAALGFVSSGAVGGAILGGLMASNGAIQSGYKYKVKEDGLGKLQVRDTAEADRYNLLNEQRVDRYDRQFEQIMDKDRKKSK